MQDAEPPRRSLKEKQRKEREELILQFAEEVLLEKGYQEASMDEIAARVGIAKGTLYLHFVGKEDLVIALFERETRAFLKTIEETSNSPHPVTSRAKLEIILHDMYKGLLGKRLQLLSSLAESADVRKKLAEKQGRLRDLWEQILARITTLLEEGKAAGEFDRTIPTPVMVSTFFGLLSPHGSERLMKQMQPEELITHLIRFYFKGIAAV